MTPCSHFICSLRLPERNYFVLWYENGCQGLVVDEQRRVIAFRSINDCRQFLRERGLRLEEEEPADYDFAQLVTWRDTPREVLREREEVLALLHFLLDALDSLDVRSPFDYPGFSTTYEKLFWSPESNPGSVRGADYVPTWEDAELERLLFAMDRGLALLLTHCAE